MAKLIKSPSIIKSAGNKPKIIREFVGKVNTNNKDLSIAYMSSPKGWVEPGQRPEFDEYTVVINGQMIVETENKNHIVVESGQGIIVKKGEWIRYSTPNEDTDYFAICSPAFSNETVHRDS